MNENSKNRSKIENPAMYGFSPWDVLKGLIIDFSWIYTSWENFQGGIWLFWAILGVQTAKMGQNGCFGRFVQDASQPSGGQPPCKTQPMGSKWSPKNATSPGETVGTNPERALSERVFDQMFFRRFDEVHPPGHSLWKCPLRICPHGFTACSGVLGGSFGPHT